MTAESNKSMIVVKSVLVGILAAVAALLMIVVCILVYLSLISGGPVQWDPVSIAGPLIWRICVIALTFFLVGFFWQFRRSRAKRSSNASSKSFC